MKKTMIVLSFIFLALASSALAEQDTCVLSSEAAEYVVLHNLSVPTTEVGCSVMNDKFILGHGQCWVVRGADRDMFKGVMGQYMDGTWRCFLPSSRNDAVQEDFVETSDSTPNVPEFGLLAGGIALLGSVTAFIIVRKKG